MAYNTKNYTEQGGETTVIGGKLIFKGTEINPIANIPSASAAPTKQEFNALLDALKASGLMTADNAT